MSRHPEVKWAQREDKVFITVQLPDATDVKVNLEPAGVLIFSGTAGAEKHLYELNLELHDKVNVEESKINKGVRNIFCVVVKAEKGWWKKLLCGDGKTPHYIKVDWDKWVDEDEDGSGDLDLGGMDFSNFGNMGGMGDMGGMGGMGDDESDDSSDEGEEAEKPAETGKDAGEEAKKSEEPQAGEKAEATPTPNIA